MKILSIGNFTHGWDGSICDEEHIAKALEEAGHLVTRLQRETVAAFDFTEYQYDFVLISQWNGYPINMVDNLPRPIVYWAFDYQAWDQDWHMRLIEGADLYLSKRIADSKFDNWQWLAQDFAPSFLEPYQHEQPKDIDVLFTGSYLDWATERNDFLKAVNEKFNLVVHSVNDWPFLDRQPPVMDHGLPRLYKRAKVILSIDHTIDAGYWSDRNGQIMACEGYVLFWYVPLSEARFGPGVDYFYNVEDGLKKIQFALDNPKHCEFVAKLGHSIATYNARLQVDGRVWDLIKIVENHIENRSI